MKMGDDKRKEDESSRVKVHIRLNQSSGKEGDAYKIFADGTQLHIPNNDGRLESDRWYRFDHIYSAIASNKEVYKLSTYDLVECALKGMNASIFAYGQTGSGKTRTLMSKDGVTAHMISHMFNRIWKSVGQDYKVACSYFQIYNERIYDLLNPQNNLECTVREDTNRGVYVDNMTCVVCETPMDVYELINIGSKSLVLAESKMNRLSCRSHAVCQLSIERRNKNSVAKKCSMQETETIIPDILVHQIVEEENKTQIDFTTVPFNKIDLRKRHSIAVTKVNENKKSPRSPRSSTSKLPPTSPSRQRARANSVKLSDRRSHTRNGSVSSDLQTTPEHRGSVSLPASQKRTRNKSTNSLPDNKPSEKKVTMVDSIGVMNLKRLNDLYHSNMVNADSEKERIQSDREMDSMFSEDGSDSFIDYDASKLMEMEGDSPWLVDTTGSNGFTDNDEKLFRSKISIIDLAGSERLSKLNVDGERLKEAQNINLSLLELGNVISALASGKKKHVPYRNSVLTRLLQDSLGGNCKTKFLLCISTKHVDTNETKCTLEFGQKLTKVYTNPILNLDIDYKRKYDKLTLQMKEKEKDHELIQEKSTTRLAEFDKEKQEAEESTSSQKVLMNSIHIKLENTDKNYKESVKKIDILQQTLVDKETALEMKDEELEKLKMEFASLLEKVEEANSSADMRKLETVTCDAATNTSLIDLSSTDKVLVESVDAVTNTTDDYLKTLYSLQRVDTCEVATNTTANHHFNDDLLKATSNATTSTADISIRNPIVVTFIQSNKTSVASVTTSTSNITAETFDATTNTSTRSIANFASLTSLNESVKSATNKFLNYAEIRKSFSTDPTSESHERLFLQNGGNIGRIKCAILVELLTLQKLSDRSRDIHHESLTSNSVLDSREELILTTNEDPIKDGVYSIISEIFCILPNMFSENQLSDEQSWGRDFDTDNNTLMNNRTSRSAPVALKYTTAGDQLVFLQDYFRNRKESIEKEMLDIAKEIINIKDIHPDIDSISEQHKLIEILIEQLSDGNSLLSNDIDNLYKLFNIVLCDHTVTSCLLALSLKRSHDRESELKSNSILEEKYYSDAVNNNNRSKLSYDLAMDSPSHKTSQEAHLISDINDNENNKDETDGKKGKSLFDRLFCMPLKSARAKKRAQKETENKM